LYILIFNHEIRRYAPFPGIPREERR